MFNFPHKTRLSGKPLFLDLPKHYYFKTSSQHKEFIMSTCDLVCTGLRGGINFKVIWTFNSF